MLSVIIPVLNEAPNLPQLVRELGEVAKRNSYELQIIIVDDGSKDATWRTIVELAGVDPRILGIRFRRNFGKAAALSAGFHAAEGERIVTIDGDLQDDPAEIAALLAKLDEGFDVVSGWKRERHDPPGKVLPSRVFNWLVSKLMGVHLHDHNCGLKAFRREVMHEIRLYGELHRFVPVLAAAKGFRTGEVVVKHRPRKHGHSKYGYSRLTKGLLDLLTVKFIVGYGQRPQHLLGTVGLAAFLLGGMGMLYLAIVWCVSRMNSTVTDDVHLHLTASLYYSLGLFIIGAQFMSIGLLGEMIAAYWIRDTDTYSIAEHTPPTAAARSLEQRAGSQNTRSAG
jgi:dolichol-phosphate mannosyltransferase